MTKQEMIEQLEEVDELLDWDGMEVNNKELLLHQIVVRLYKVVKNLVEDQC